MSELPTLWETTVGDRRYELTEHRGNVLAVVSDLKNSKGEASVKEAHNYDPFGMKMDERSIVGDYRFGFQGQESEGADLWGGNNSFFKFRLSHNAIGRFFAVDPLTKDYPHNSPYAFSENRLIDARELEGLELKTVTAWVDHHADGEPYIKKVGYIKGNCGCFYLTLVWF